MVSPIQMRFVNIFHFRDGLIVQQYDNYDNADYYKAVKEWKEKAPANKKRK